MGDKMLLIGLAGKFARAWSAPQLQAIRSGTVSVEVLDRLGLPHLLQNFTDIGALQPLSTLEPVPMDDETGAMPVLPPVYPSGTG